MNEMFDRTRPPFSIRLINTDRRFEAPLSLLLPRCSIFRVWHRRFSTTSTFENDRAGPRGRGEGLGVDAKVARPWIRSRISNCQFPGFSGTDVNRRLCRVKGTPGIATSDDINVAEFGGGHR